MQRFKTSGHSASPQDQIINVFESLFFIKKLGTFMPFYGVTEPTPLRQGKVICILLSDRNLKILGP